MPETTKPQHLLEHAAARYGVAPLAKKLKVPEGRVAAWLTGHAAMPDGTVLLLAALVQKGQGNEQ